MSAHCFCLALAFGLAGCTTLQPLAGSAPELRQQIAAGQLLKPGDRVVITTTDGRRHRLAVAATDSATVRGKRDSIPIDQIDSVQKRVFSAAETAALVLGIGLAAYITAEVLVAPAAILASTH